MVYVDNSFHCHAENPGGTYTPIETDFFDGKCRTFVEGHCAELNDDGTIKQIYPWKPSSELAAAQAQYERDMAELAAAYREGVNSV